MEQNLVGPYRSSENINNCEYMIENGHLKMLETKVYNGDNLSFNYVGKRKQKILSNLKYENNINNTTTTTTTNNNNNKKSITYHRDSIFSVFKNDGKFFLNLFNNYKLQFQLLPECDIKSSLNQIEQMAIQYDNVAVLETLINHFKHVPTVTTFIQSIDIGSFEIANYLLKQFKNQIQSNENHIETLWTVAIKIYHYEELDLAIKRIEYLVDQLEIVPPNPSKFQLPEIEQLFDFQISSLPIRTLLKCCNIANILKDQFKQYIESQTLDNGFKKVGNKNKNSYVLEQFKTISKNELDEIKEQLLQIDNGTGSGDYLDTLVFSVSKDDKIVESLFTMFIKFTPISKSCSLLLNYEYYKEKYHGLAIGARPVTDEPLDENWEDANDIELHYYTKKFPSNQLDKVYTYFKNLIVNPDWDRNNWENVDGVLSTALDYNNYQVLEMLCSELKSNFVNHSPPYQYIKYNGSYNQNEEDAIKMFDMFQKYDIKSNERLMLFIYDYKLANHYKSNYTNDYYQFLNNPIQFDVVNRIHSQYPLSFKKYQFIFENWKDFTIEIQEKFIESIYLSVKTQEIPFDDFKSFLSVTNVQFEKHIKLYQTPSGAPLGNCTIDQISFLMDKYPNVFNQEKYSSDASLLSIQLFIHYLNNDLTNLFSLLLKIQNQFNFEPTTSKKQQSPIPSFTHLCKEISNRNDTQILNNIINDPTINNNIKLIIVKEVLLLSTQFGNFINFYSFLLSSNYSSSVKQLFSKDTKSVFLNSLFKSSISNNQIGTVVYLINNLNLNIIENNSFLEKQLKQPIDDNNCFIIQYFKSKK